MKKFIYSFSLILLMTSELSLAQTVSVEEKSGLRVITTEYGSGWTVEETVKTNDGELSRCVLTSSFNAPTNLELISAKGVLDIAIWDTVFAQNFKEGEKFNET